MTVHKAKYGSVKKPDKALVTVIKNKNKKTQITHVGSAVAFVITNMSFLWTTLSQ